MNYPEFKRAAVEQARIHQPNYILIKDRASGTQFIHEMREANCSGITAYEPKCDKIVRMDTATSPIENGFVYLPESAPWLNVLTDELIAFPKNRHDDQVASISQSLDWVKQRIGVPGEFCTSLNYQRCWYERSLEWREERSIRRSRS